MKIFERTETKCTHFVETLVVQQVNGADARDLKYRPAALDDLKRQAWAEGFMLVPREANHCDDTAVLRTLVRERYIEALELATGER